jgi:hypothetical protein
MRPVYVCALLTSCLGLLAQAAPPSDSSADVTVIIDYKGSYSPVAMREMRREAAQIIGASGISLDWRTRSDSQNATFNDLVVMTFRGSCSFDPAPPIYDELGPLAVTRTSNGEVQPFGEVNCDRVVNSVRGAMFGEDYAHGDLLLGRALGRVVAHELVHMLTKSGRHAHEGVQRAALSGRQLIGTSLPLDTLDVDRLAEERRVR